MPANILDPRMIDPSKPLSCLEIKTSNLTASNSIVTNNIVTANLSSISITTSLLTATNIEVSSANITQITIDQATINNSVFAGTVVTNFSASVIDQPVYVFYNSDNSRIYHFDTDTQPSITATFLSGNISEGFNVGIVNTGLGVIYLSSDFIPIINASNTFNSVRHSGMFIYRTNNQLFGIGVFE